MTSRPAPSGGPRAGGVRRATARSRRHVGRAAPRPCAAPGCVGAAVEARLGDHPPGALPAGGCSRRHERATSQRGTASSTCRRSQRGLLISDVEAAGTPILLVHGMVDNRSIFTLLRRGLRAPRLRPGARRMNYSLAHRATSGSPPPGWPRRSRPIVAETGYERIHVVGHSHGRPDRPLLRHPARRRRAGAHPRHAGHAARRAPTRPTAGTPARPASCARAAALRELDRPVPGLPDPVRRLLVATWTR